MAPSCPNSVLRLLTSTLLLVGITYAIALPQGQQGYAIIDSRSPSTQQQDNEPLAIAGSQILDSDGDAHNVAVTLNNQKEPDSFFEDLGDFLSQYNIGDFIRYMFGGSRRGKKGRPVATSGGVKTVFITPSAFVPPGPSLTASTSTVRSSRISTQRSTTTVLLPAPSLPTTRAEVATPGIQNAVLTDQLATTSTLGIPTITTSTSTFGPSMSILPFMSNGEHLSDNVTWPSLTIVSGTAEFSLPTQTDVVISYWPLPEPTSSSGDETATETASEAATATALFLPFSWNATLASFPTRPLIYTNPLRPTEEAWTNATIGNVTSTTTINITSTRYYTLFVVPTPVEASGTISPSGPPFQAPLYPNTTYSAATGSPTNTSPVIASTPRLPFILAIPTPSPVLTNTTNTTTDYTTNALRRLRQICTDPTIRTITLPLLNRFYGPNAYPSLHPFPGCIPANPSQALRAPGLLNCTLLGTEVQRCQQNGRRVLISVRADAPSVVDGNTDYGRPSVAPSGVRLPLTLATSGVALEPLWPNTNWSAIRAGGVQPNLFDATHHPTSLALTLFSLFGEGHTERADLRPLGPDPTNTTASPVSWFSRPLGEEVVVDGYDVRVPSSWKGTFQDGEFKKLVGRLRELNGDAWLQSGGKKGGAGDLGADGKGVVVFGWSSNEEV